MKGAALIFGLLAGLLGGAAIAMGNLASGLNLALSLGDDLFAKSILYSILVVGLIGTGLVLAWPKAGGAIMVLCALGWAVAGLVAGHGSVLFAALPIIFAGAGGVVAMFVRPRLDADDEIDDDAPPRRDGRRRLADVDFDDRRPVPMPRARGPQGRAPGIRSEPDFDIEPPRAAPTRYRADPPDYPDETSSDDDAGEEDYIDADPALDDEGLVDPDTDYPADEEEDEPRYRNDPPPPRRGQDRWSLPDPREQRPRRSPPRQDYVPERQPPAPLRREPLPPRNDARPARRQRNDDDDYYRPEDNYPPPRREPPRGRSAYSAIAYDEPEEADEPRRGPLRSFFRIIIMLVFVVIVLGAATAVYFAYPNLPSVLFGKGTRPVAETISPAPTTESPAADTGAEASVPTSEVAPAAAMPATPVAAAAPAAPVPLAGSAEAASTPDMSSPFDYCHLVDTIDTPDDRYTGPAVPPEVASALSFSSPPPANQVFWRCAGQAVYACNSKGGPACNLTPTVDMMLSYCAAHADAKNLPAPNGSWSCNGKRPSIPRDQEWPVDARGFYPGAWTRVAPPTG